MKTKIILLLALFSVTALFAKETVFIHKADLETVGVKVAKTDSIWFSSDSEIMFLSANSGDTTAQYAVSAIDSLSFGNNSDTVFVTWETSAVSIINPLAFEGVTVKVSNNDVTVNSIYEDNPVVYVLSGTTSDGSFKLYSEKKSYILLNSVSINNTDGPAINLQSGKNSYIVLVDGSENHLSDGTTYAEAPLNSEGVSEDQKATFFAEGDMKISGSGSLTVTSNGSEAHAIASDDGIEISSGSITVTSSQKDALHGKDGIEISGGTITTTQTSDGLDGDEGHIIISGGDITLNAVNADTKAITADSSITISGGNLTLNASGDQSKAIKCDEDIIITGGTLNITTSGNAVLEALTSGYDPSYCTAIKSDKNVSIENATVTIKTTGKGGKGISADGNITILSGSNVNITCSGNGEKYTNENGEADAYRSTCLIAEGTITLYDGTTTLYNSGTAGMGIKAETDLVIGSAETTPIINVTTTGNEISLGTSTGPGGGPGGGGPGHPGGDNSTDAAESKAVKGDSLVYIISGTITVNSADDGIKSADSILITGGTINVTKSFEGFEAPYITITGGEINIQASDDVINATKGNGGENDDGSILTISGGRIVLYSGGNDAMDSNGSAVITGGTIIIHGVTSNVEVAADVNGTFKITGGLFIAAGSYSNMAQNFSSATQNSAMFHWNQNASASALFHIEDESGNNIVTFQPKNNYSYILFSSPNFANGIYKVYTGGSSTASQTDGLYEDGTYSGGTLKKTITISKTINNFSW